MIRPTIKHNSNCDCIPCNQVFHAQPLYHRHGKIGENNKYGRYEADNFCYVDVLERHDPFGGLRLSAGESASTDDGFVISIYP